MSLLTDRSQSTKVNGVCSLSLDITRSIVQGSGIGPFAFITYVNDCKTLGHDNCVLKYADNFSLLVPENSHVSAASEMVHNISWSESNKLKINLVKCRELVFKRLNLKHISIRFLRILCLMLFVLNCLVYILIVLCAFMNMSNTLQKKL